MPGDLAGWNGGAMLQYATDGASAAFHLHFLFAILVCPFSGFGLARPISIAGRVSIAGCVCLHQLGTLEWWVCRSN